MFKIFIEGEVIGGTLVHQAEIKGRVAAKLEKRLNDSEVESVICVTPAQDDNEFQLVAVVKVTPPAPEKKKGGK